ncbi:uncharacterized protein LOC113850807 [Abrus precatorius]|uniref:Uncharacterized protein LOC113850807 n=1 Tax=Abrus precatorius TaxID=3816 RepID=A0A8B8K043_ABRPR|nr:uncharacterized protein LOC113850807 [Abrus precatorius]
MRESLRRARSVKGSRGDEGGNRHKSAVFIDPQVADEILANTFESSYKSHPSDPIMEVGEQLATAVCDDEVVASRLIDIGKKVGIVVHGNDEQIGSFNSRGLGSEVKQKKVCEIVRSEGLEFLAIQETKLETCNRNLCAHLWGSMDFDWIALPSIGRSGGIFSLWDTSEGKILLSFSGTGFLGVCLQVLAVGNLCVVLNVYASCRLSEKRKLWDDLLMTRKGFSKFMLCILGNFNAVRQVNEKKGCQGDYGISKMDDFNSFIQEIELVNLSLAERVLVSGSWIDYWGDGFIQVLSRDVSNHCPIILKHKVVNWGSNPFRFNNCWLTHKRVMEVVEEAWQRGIILSWAAQRASQRLRNVKIALKNWNVEVFGNVDKVISDLTTELSLIDDKNFVKELSDVEKERQQILVGDIWKIRKNKESLIAQKARVRCGKEDDLNTKFFHLCVDGRR